MTYFDIYKTRLGASGDTIKELILNNTNNLISGNFANSPNYTQIYINDLQVTSDALVLEGDMKWGVFKRIITKWDTPIKLGDLITFDDNKWLVVYMLQDIDLYYSALIRKCNQTLTIQIGTTQVFKGYDSMGRPVYDVIPSYSSWDCIVDKKIFNTANFDEPINLPHNRISVIIPYTDNSYITYNTEFSMWGDVYKIIGIDRTNVVGTEGIITIIAELVV